VERGDIVLRTAGGALLRLIDSGDSGRAAVAERAAQLRTQLEKEIPEKEMGGEMGREMGAGAEQSALVLAASGGLSEPKFAAGAARSIGRSLVRLSKSTSVEVRLG